MNTPLSPTATPRWIQTRARRGFSMVEVLGIMAIAALLALAIVPMMLSELDRLALQQEETSLKRIAEGIEKYVVRNQILPDQSAWGAAVSAAIGDATDRVLTNSRGQRRVLLIDPTFGIGPGGTNKPPYTQTASGSSAVSNPRYVIVSSMGRDLPATFVSGYAATSTAFDEIWNLADGAAPASWSWSGNGTDLRVQRVNLTPLFHQVTLNNATALTGKYSVNSSSPSVLPSTTFTTYLLAGTVLGLHGVDSSTQAKEMVTRSFSFSFEDGLWRGRLFAGTAAGSTTVTGADLEAAASSFLSAPNNPTATATPAQVMAAVQTYLTAYNVWAAAGFPATGSTKTAVDAAQLALDSLAAGLVN